MSAFEESLRWYLVSLAAGLAIAPFARWLFGRLPGHGAAFVRPIGLLAMVWPVWFLASISPIPYSTPLLWGVVILGGVGGWALAYRAGWLSRLWARDLIAAELVFLVVFAGAVIFKGFTPRIAGTEKPMDVAFLASTIRATDMPPPDQWLTPESINYYYLGFLINGSVARMSDLPSWIAYNLALAGTFAMTLTAAVGLAWAIGARIGGQRVAAIAGGLGAFLVVIAGNLRAPARFLQNPSGLWNAFWWPTSSEPGIGWASSRVVVDENREFTETINEFPSFSFILGDLHPHVTALPFTVVALALAVSLFLRGRRGLEAGTRPWREVAAGGAVVGALYPLNSWDFPTYAGAAAIAILLAGGVTFITVAQVAVLGVAGVVSWSPFWLTFVPFAGGSVEGMPNIPGIRFIGENVAVYPGEWTSVTEYLTVFGIPWLIAMVYLIVETVGERRAASSADEVMLEDTELVSGEAETVAAGEGIGGSEQASGPVSYARGALFAAAAIAALLAIALPAPVILLAGIPVVLAARLLMRRWETDGPAEKVIQVLMVVGFAITILTEFFYIRDVFNGRFNTLFKIYYQVWTLLGIASALALALLWQRARSIAGARALVTAGIALIVALGAVYPVVSGKTWIAFTNPSGEWLGLDGLAQHGPAEDLGDGGVERVGYSPGDVAAIRWLNENAREDDILLEVPGCQYEVNSQLPTSRFSAFTGIPTVIGWAGAERQWRGGQPELRSQIEPRAGDVSAMYEDPNPSTNPLFDQYGITLLVVGSFEQNGSGESCPIGGPYDALSVDAYPGPGWSLVFEAGETRIYRRTEG